MGTTVKWAAIDENAPVVVGQQYRMDMGITSPNEGAKLRADVDRAIHDALTHLNAQETDVYLDVLEVSALTRTTPTFPPTYTLSVVFAARRRAGVGGTSPVVALVVTLKIVAAVFGTALALTALAYVVWVLFFVSEPPDFTPPLTFGVWVLVVGGLFILLYPSIVKAIRAPDLGRGAPPHTG